MAQTPPLPPKRDVASSLLEGVTVLVHLDPRKDGVLVPEWLKNQPQLVLRIGVGLSPPIPDLDVGADGIGCTLSFNRTPFFCFMPYAAIFGLVGEDGRGMIWPDDVPPELAQRQQQRPKLEAVSDGPKRAAKKVKSRAVEPVASEPEPEPRAEAPAAPKEDAPAEAGKKRPLPPYLRVVK
jgi:hypothetical protein